MLSHISLGVADLDRAQAFYDAVLAPLGVVRVWRFDDAVGYGLPGGQDKLALFLHAASGERLAAGPGFHLCFAASSQESVAAFHAAALEHGGADEGAPGLRPHYGPTYYAAFVRDPDGHKLESKHA